MSSEQKLEEIRKLAKQWEESFDKNPTTETGFVLNNCADEVLKILNAK